jgi:uncharacterized protein
MLAAALAACTSPPTRYYRLAVVPGAIQSIPPLTVGVRSVSIPGYLNQNGIAKDGGDDEFDVYSNNLWAEPLADMLQTTMVQDLAQRLPGSTVIGSGGSIGEAADVLIEINLLRFDPDSAGKIVLSAQSAVRSGRTRALWITQTFERSAAPDGPGVASLVSKMSMLWGAMADQVADLIVENRAG